MKEICLVNKGDNVQKLVVSMGISNSSKIEKDRIIENNYIVVDGGTEDVVVVRNYNPYYIKKITENNSLLDIYAQGFEVKGSNNPTNDDLVVIKKICGIRYIVKPLEKLETIANNFGVSKQDIIEKNNLLTDKLFVGQVLII